MSNKEYDILRENTPCFEEKNLEKKPKKEINLFLNDGQNFHSVSEKKIEMKNSKNIKRAITERNIELIERENIELKKKENKLLILIEQMKKKNNLIEKNLSNLQKEKIDLEIQKKIDEEKIINLKNELDKTKSRYEQKMISVNEIEDQKEKIENFRTKRSYFDQDIFESFVITKNDNSDINFEKENSQKLSNTILKLKNNLNYLISFFNISLKNKINLEKVLFINKELVKKMEVLKKNISEKEALIKSCQQKFESEYTCFIKLKEKLLNDKLNKDMSINEGSELSDEQLNDIIYTSGQNAITPRTKLDFFKSSDNNELLKNKLSDIKNVLKTEKLKKNLEIHQRRSHDINLGNNLIEDIPDSSFESDKKIKKKVSKKKNERNINLKDTHQMFFNTNDNLFLQKNKEFSNLFVKTENIEKYKNKDKKNNRYRNLKIGDNSELDRGDFYIDQINDVDINNLKSYQMSNNDDKKLFEKKNEKSECTYSSFEELLDFLKNKYRNKIKLVREKNMILKTMFDKVFSYFLKINKNLSEGKNFEELGSMSETKIECEILDEEYQEKLKEKEQSFLDMIKSFEYLIVKKIIMEKFTFIKKCLKKINEKDYFAKVIKTNIEKKQQSIENDLKVNLENMSKISEKLKELEKSIIGFIEGNKNDKKTVNDSAHKRSLSSMNFSSKLPDVKYISNCLNFFAKLSQDFKITTKSDLNQIKKDFGFLEKKIENFKKTYELELNELCNQKISPQNFSDSQKKKLENKQLLAHEDISRSIKNFVFFHIIGILSKNNFSHIELPIENSLKSFLVFLKNIEKKLFDSNFIILKKNIYFKNSDIFNNGSGEDFDRDIYNSHFIQDKDVTIYLFTFDIFFIKLVYKFVESFLK